MQDISTRDYLEQYIIPECLEIRELMGKERFFLFSESSPKYRTLKLLPEVITVDTYHRILDFLDDGMHDCLQSVLETHGMFFTASSFAINGRWVLEQILDPITISWGERPLSFDELLMSDNFDPLAILVDENSPNRDHVLKMLDNTTVDLFKYTPKQQYEK